MKRIAQVNLNDSGGAFNLMYQVQKELNGKVIFDYYTVHPFTKDEIIRDINNMGGRIVEVKASSRLLAHIKLPFVFYKIMRKEKYGIIHIHSDMAWKLSLYAIPAKLAGVKKVIVHSHSSGINGDHKALKKICHYLMKPALPYFADVLCTCSDFATGWMYPSKYKKGVQLIKNGVKTKNFRFSEEKRKTYRKELGLKDKEVLIGTTGNLSYLKNPKYLIEVFSAMYQQDTKYKLIFIGDGPDAEDVAEQARKIKGYENIIFYGNTFDVGGMLSALDIFIMPSRAEGFPISAVEAQTNGLFCILSSCITKEVDFSDKCVYWTIEDPPDVWADKMMNYNINDLLSDRENGWILAQDKGFDIRQTAETVFGLYR